MSEKPEGALPGRKRRRKKRRGSWTFGDFLRAFLLMNIVPLGGAVVILVLRSRGDIEPITLPEGSMTTLVILGVLLVALVLFASLSLPQAHRAVGAVGAGVAGRKLVVSGQAPGSRVLSVLSLPFLSGLYVLLWVVRLALMVISVGLIAVFIVFCIRLLVPDFLQEWVDRGLEWTGMMSGT